MSLPEILLWEQLRTRPQALKFRRQHPTGPYTLDFYCNDARLAIEVDGEMHRRGNRPALDSARDAWIARAGVETLRISAAEVLNDVEGVTRLILARANERLPLHHAASRRGPPPPGKLGEE